MATGTQTTPSVRRAQMMRQAWQRMGGSTMLASVGAFFLAYPPLAQGLYYVLRGLWPLLSTSAFEHLARTEIDFWFAKTSGMLVLLIGATLCLAAYRRQGSPEVLLLAFGSALGLIVLDLVFLVYGHFSVLYFVDALLQAGLVVLWAYGWRRQLQLARQAEAAASTVPAAPAAPPVAPSSVAPAPPATTP